MSDFARQLDGDRLTTAEILYYMPDHPNLLQSFVWQFHDRAPRYPKLHEFLDYWRINIDAVIHSVSIASRETIGPSRTRTARAILHLN